MSVACYRDTPRPDAAACGPGFEHIHDPFGLGKGDGTGETIALIEMYHDPNLSSDLHTFDQQYGLPDPTLTVDDQAGTRDGQRLDP